MSRKIQNNAQIPKKILTHQQNNTFSNRNNSLRSLPNNSKRPETQNSIRTEINALKQGQNKIVQGQNKIVQGQNKIVQGQAKIVAELRNMSTSINNLSTQIAKLAQEIHNGKNSKKGSLNQSFTSDFSKYSSRTAIYIRRNEKKNSDKKEGGAERKEISKPKIDKITSFRHYTKVNRKTK